MGLILLFYVYQSYEIGYSKNSKQANEIIGGASHTAFGIDGDIGLIWPFAFFQAAREPIQQFTAGLSGTCWYCDIKEGAGQFDIILVPDFGQKPQRDLLIGLIFHGIAQLDILRTPVIKTEFRDENVFHNLLMSMPLHPDAKGNSQQDQEQDAAFEFVVGRPGHAVKTSHKV